VHNRKFRPKFSFRNRDLVIDDTPVDSEGLTPDASLGDSTLGA